MPRWRGSRASWSTLACDVPLPDPLDELELQGIPDAPLRAFLEHHGFKSLLNRLSAVADAPVEPTRRRGWRRIRPAITMPMRPW
jgi:hypothetical protein